MRLIVETSDGGPVGGWEYLWSKHVAGFDHTTHCAACLRGGWDRTVKVGMMPGSYEIELRAPYFYLCGVADEGYFRNNLHLPVVAMAGETAEVVAWTGDRFRIEGARELAIPELPHLWKGMDYSYTTCRNFQWALATFGWPNEKDGGPATPDPKSKARVARYRRAAGPALFGARAEAEGYSRFAVGRVKSANGGWHIVERSRAGHLRCDCPSWKFQRSPPDSRACRHTMAFREVELGVPHADVEVFAREPEEDEEAPAGERAVAFEAAQEARRVAAGR